MACSSVTYLFAIFLFFAIVQLGSTFNCYQCGKMHSGCNDPTDKTLLEPYSRPCPAGTTACLKVEHPEDDDVFMRRCSDADGCLTYKKCSSCSSELCNASSNVLPSIIVMGITSILFGLRNYY